MALTLVVGSILGLTGKPAAATTLWWFGEGGDQRWNNALNWVAEPSSMPAVPTANDATYITTSDHPGLEDIPAASIDSSMLSVDQAETASLYIGGWDASLDAHHGSPLGHHGVLDISGDLYIADRSWGAPPCYYMRLGHRGARGTINQSGGSVSSCTLFSVAFKSADGIGIWNMSGGSAAGYGLDLGVQGTGILDMTGGEMTPMAACGTSGCRTNIGRGYWTSETSTLPGVGFVNQSGGLFHANNMRLGEKAGSVGTVAVRNQADFRGSNRLEIGYSGTGVLVQTGGTVTAGNLYLGLNPGSFGQYTIEAGALTQWGSHFYNGRDGAGHFMVTGPESTVSIAGHYEQNALGLLTALIEDDPGNISAIDVAGTATFAAGAKLRVMLEQGFTPREGDEFVLLRAGGGIADRGLELIGNREDWVLSVDARSVKVKYTTAPRAVDVVTITKARYKAGPGELKIRATSSEQPEAVLTVVGFGQMTFKGRYYELKLRPLSPLPAPASVIVISSLGGASRVPVQRRPGARARPLPLADSPERDD